MHSAAGGPAEPSAPCKPRTHPCPPSHLERVAPQPVLHPHLRQVEGTGEGSEL